MTLVFSLRTMAPKLVATTDFFTPIVDDPFTYGAAAAANALSDIYAMGADPLYALSIVLFPEKLDGDILRQILDGAASVCREANCPVIGGHSVRCDQITFGLAITGKLADGVRTIYQCRCPGWRPINSHQTTRHRVISHCPEKRCTERAFQQSPRYQPDAPQSQRGKSVPTARHHLRHRRNWFWLSRPWLGSRQRIGCVPAHQHHRSTTAPRY